VLARAKAEGVGVCAFFPSFTFQAQLVHIDPRAGRILMSRSAVAAANAAVLARQRVRAASVVRMFMTISSV